MLGQPQPYLINLKNINLEDRDLVGFEALETSFLHSQSIPTPAAFVVTTRAFDDFLTATQLVEPILKLISETDSSNFKEKSSEIRKLIIETPLPSIIERPIIEGYRNLSSSNMPFVTLEVSNVIKQEFIIKNLHHHIALNIYGVENFIKALKNSWAELFNDDAIKLRLEKQYEGILTTAVIVQKMIKPEISGKVYSMSEDAAKYIYVSAIYGLENLNEISKNQKDIYKVEIDNMQIKEKKIFQQTKMLVRKGKAKVDEDPNMEVNISAEWQDTQKIEDDRILKLAELTLKINQYLHKNIELSWGIEAGEVSIFTIHNLDFNKEKKSEVTNKKIVSEIIKVSEVKEEEIIEKVTLEKEIPIEIKHEIILKIPEVIETDKSINQRNLLTKIFIDSGDMHSDILAEIIKWKNAYVDGTNLILNTQTLPEFQKGKEEIINYIKSLSMQISNLASILEGNELIYSLSNIDENIARLLALTKEQIPYFNDERFINNENALITEVAAVKKSRNEDKHRNILLAISGIRSYENLMKIKRTISSEGLRRSPSLKMFAEITFPLLAMEADNIENDDVDGLIFNFGEFTRNTIYKLYPAESDYMNILKELKKIRDVTKSKNLLLIVKFGFKPSEKLIKEILLLQPYAIIVNYRLEESDLDLIEKVEREFFEKMLVPLKKRGRKIKNLF